MRLIFVPLLFAATTVYASHNHGIKWHDSHLLRHARRAATKTALTNPDDPTMTGIASNCNAYYDVVSGDTCTSVEEAFGITHDEFISWNPAVSSDCTTNFWTGESYCVGVSTSSASATTTVALSASRTAATTGPDDPTMSGISSACNKWYDVQDGDTCTAIEVWFNITHSQFLSWNPAVSSDCETNFWTDESYCVGVNSSLITTTSAPVATTTAVYSSIAANRTTATVTTSNSTWPPAQTQTGQPASCNKWYQAWGSDTCDSIVNRFSTYVTSEDFLDWNPAVGSNCTGLYAGYWYCVGIQPTTSAVDNSTATTQFTWGWTATVYPTVNSTFVVTPIQTGIASDCEAYYMAQDGDTCANITSSLGYLTEAEFEEWNPAVGSDCSGLVVGDYYCVQSGDSEPLPSTISTLPSPVQSGISSSCTAYYLASDDDDCDSIVEIFGTFSESDFLSWNPAVGSDCSGLVIGDYYCVAVPGTPTTRTASASAVATPAVVSGVPSDCDSYWLVGQSDNCTSITNTTGISLTDFETWNPSLGSDCSGLEEDTYVCVGVSSNATTTTTGTATTTATTGISTPTPIQTGMVSGCERFYLVESGNDCYDIAADAGITLTNFYDYNPAVGTDCSALIAGDYVCIGLSGPVTTITTGTPVPGTTATTASAVATPTPIQTSMVSGCIRFYYVEAGDGCWAIATDAGITTDQFYDWNPAVGTDCSNLEADTYVCIGISGTATTITSGTPVAQATSTGSS